jgi:hypothetical protein
MEAHHHTHATHGKKNWKSYFWEFLMLFLAVFCGFLAEYQLEHKIEKERAKKYVISFCNDLATDTAEFKKPIAWYEDIVAVLKNRQSCYESFKQNKSPDSCLYEMFIYSSGFPDLITEDQTLQQLKNSGGLRLLNDEDADSILSYDKMIRWYLKGEATGLQERQYKLRDIITTLLNHEYDPSVNNTKPVRLLYSDNRELVNKYFNTLDFYYNNCRFNLDYLKNLKTKATGIILFFKNKYHFK